MAKFVFRVQAALDMRRKQEDEAKQALAAAETRRREAQAHCDQARDALTATIERATRSGATAGTT